MMIFNLILIFQYSSIDLLLSTRSESNLRLHLLKNRNLAMVHPVETRVIRSLIVLTHLRQGFAF